MVFAGEERRTNLPSNTKVKAFSPVLILMIVIYPTLLAFVFVARLATFALLTPTPTVPGAPPSHTGTLHGAQDLWETQGAVAIIRTLFAFASIAGVHLVILLHLCLRRGPPGAPYTDAGFACAASIALWLTTTCFFITYTSMARYGAHAWEWCVALGFSAVIFLVTIGHVPSPDADKAPGENPARVIA